MIVVVDCSDSILSVSTTTQTIVSHLFPQPWNELQAFYFTQKRVKYGSGRIGQEKALSQA